MRRYRLHSIFLVLLCIAGSLAPATAAQSPCPHVDFRIDSTLAVDQTAVCEAAQPWSEQGIRLFVYLTDVDPGSEAAWFALLDQVETEAGLRSGDSFDRNALALQASATSNATWAQTLTYGETLYDTPIDGDSGANQVKSVLRQGLQQGDATAAFSNAITTAYTLNYPPPAPPSPAARGLATGAIVLVAVLLLGGGAALLYFTVLRPAQARRRRKQALQAHLESVRQNVANLLLACERLLSGDTPQATVLYQLFAAYGGQHYPERDKAVQSLLRQSQAALSDAFDLRRSLLSEEVQQQKSLAEQVRNWEMIYLTLTGSSPRILNLTNSELQDLLDPLVILEREAQDGPLAQQLDEIRREIKGLPLKIELQAVDPETVDREGILGSIDQVEAHIGTLMAAQEAAPGALADAQQGRLAAEEEADTARPFGMTGSQILTGISARLATAEADLAAGKYVQVVETAASVERDLDIVADLLAAAADHAERSAQITAITDAGFQPADLPADQTEIENDVAQIVAQIRAGDYLAADDWIDELDADGERALAHAQSWQERHAFNVESLRLMRERLTEVEHYLTTKVDPAWQALQAYPSTNWDDISEGLAEEQAALRDLRDVRLPYLHQLNSLAVQEIPAAEGGLAEAGKQLLGLQRRLETLVNRLDEVRKAEANLPQGLTIAAEELATAVAFRDAHDPKIGPEVDRQLAQASQRLEDARTALAARAFIDGMQAETDVRELVAEAHAAASEQVAKIDALHIEMGELSNDAAQQARRALALGQQMTPLALTAETADLLTQVGNHISTARQAQAETLSLQDHGLATALETAVAAFKAAEALGEEAEQRINADFEAYQTQRRAAEAAIQEAEQAIHRARRQVSHPHAGQGGRQALQRAERTLPPKTAVAKASKAALQQIQKDAQLATQYAHEAERKAQQDINFRRMQQAAAWTVLSGMGRQRRRGGSWAPTSRPRTSNRSAFGGSSRRSSGFGGSRRSSGGGARRSSSGGGSRRR